MNRILYENRCRCNEEFSITKNVNQQLVVKENHFSIQKPNEVISKTFQIKYQKNLSSTAKVILNSFQNKYIYYAIDDILYGLEINSN